MRRVQIDVSKVGIITRSTGIAKVKEEPLKDRISTRLANPNFEIDEAKWLQRLKHSHTAAELFYGEKFSNHRARVGGLKAKVSRRR